MPKISEKELNLLALGGAKVKRQTVSRVPTASEVAATQSEPAPVRPPPAPADSSIPLAAMQANTEAITSAVNNNSRAIDEFRQELAKEPPPRKPWRHKVVRDRNTKLIDYVDSVPMVNK